MSEEKGVKNLKDILDLALVCVDMVSAAQADGKIDFTDLTQLMKLVPAAGPAIDGIGEIPAELSDLSESEASELITHVVAKLSVDNEKAKIIVEAGLKALIANYLLFKAIKL